VASSKINFLEPWHEFVPGQGEAFLTELRRELPLGHPLADLELLPLGHSGATDDALFCATDGRVFQVHITHSQQAERSPWPRYRVYSNVGEWMQQVLLSADDEDVG